MSERRKLDRERLKRKPSLRKEWVPIEAGDVCVWGMNAAQILSLGERIRRPEIDPRGGVDTTAAALWLILICTHLSDEEGSPPVWSPATIGEIAELSAEDFRLLSEAAENVNGRGTRIIQEARDFTKATEAPNTSECESSASSSSADSPASSTT